MLCCLLCPVVAQLWVVRDWSSLLCHLPTPRDMPTYVATLSLPYRHLIA
jgi:hypothetical protein